MFHQTFSSTYYIVYGSIMVGLLLCSLLSPLVSRSVVVTTTEKDGTITDSTRYACVLYGIMLSYQEPPPPEPAPSPEPGDGGEHKASSEGSLSSSLVSSSASSSHSSDYASWSSSPSVSTSSASSFALASASASQNGAVETPAVKSKDSSSSASVSEEQIFRVRSGAVAKPEPTALVENSYAADGRRVVSIRKGHEVARRWGRLFTSPTAREDSLAAYRHTLEQGEQTGGWGKADVLGLLSPEQAGVPQEAFRFSGAVRETTSPEWEASSLLLGSNNSRAVLPLAFSPSRSSVVAGQRKADGEGTGGRGSTTSAAKDRGASSATGPLSSGCSDSDCEHSRITSDSASSSAPPPRLGVRHDFSLHTNPFPALRRSCIAYLVLLSLGLLLSVALVVLALLQVLPAVGQGAYTMNSLRVMMLVLVAVNIACMGVTAALATESHFLADLSEGFYVTTSARRVPVRRLRSGFFCTIASATLSVVAVIGIPFIRAD